MTIKYIFGRSGRGKTHYVFEQIKESLQRDEEQPLILLVPEQITHQTERDIIEKLQLPGMMRLQVLSFSRLGYHVLNEVGGRTRTVINQQGKNMVLRKVLDECCGELSIYKKAAKQDGFVVRMADFLGQLKQHAVSPEDLQEKVDVLEAGGAARRKLQDITVIYERFNRYLEDRYLDNEDVVNAFIARLAEASCLQGAAVWIDGFTTFTPQTLQIIEQIMLVAGETTFTFPLNPAVAEADSDLFERVQETYERVAEIAQQHGLQAETLNLNETYPSAFKCASLQHLEREFFAYPHQLYDEVVADMEVFAAGSMNTEMEHVAAQILNLVRDKGYRWKDIAVVCGDLACYGSLIQRTFNENNIPYFIDQRRDIMDNPIIEYILSLLEMVYRNYRYEPVFCFLKTGFSDLTADEVEKLENYVLQYGIEGKQWQEVFRYGDDAALAELNLCREKFMGLIAEFAQQVKGKQTVAEMTTALYEHLVNSGIYEKLTSWIETLRARGFHEAVGENTQIWNTVMEILDQIVEILGDQTVTVREYKRVLEAGFSACEIGLIPPTLDQVLVGQIQRSKSHSIKALFVVGVNDGILPNGRNDERVLAEEEKVLLKEKGLDLGTDHQTQAAEERFAIYQALTKPDAYLWVSFALANGEGKALRPSIFIDRFQKVFPQLEIKSDGLNTFDNQLQMVCSPQMTFKYLIENLRLHLDGTPAANFWWDVYRWYDGQDCWCSHKAAVLKGFFHQNQIETIEPSQAQALYGLPLHTSVSRLEQFNSCPFAHFVKYGLQPEEREVREIGAPDIGLIFHAALNKFSQSLAQQQLVWRELEKEPCCTLMDSIMDELAGKYENGILLSSQSYQNMVSRLKRVMRRAVWVLTEHIKKGDFTPLEHEVSFGEQGQLPSLVLNLDSGDKVYMEGRIDRVDLLDDGTDSYVRIIDYKSGDKKLSLSDVYHGLALQLMVYLSAILDSGDALSSKLLKPGGVFYFRLDDPLIETAEMDDAEIEREIRKKLKMRGLVLEDIRVVRGMDRDIQTRSEIIPVAIGKEDKFHKSSAVAGETDFLGLLAHVKGLVKDRSEALLSGDIRISPVKNGQQTACDYCPYAAICQFDGCFEDNGYHVIKPLKDEDVLSRMTAEQEVTVDGELD